MPGSGSTAGSAAEAIETITATTTAAKAGRVHRRAMMSALQTETEIADAIVRWFAATRKNAPALKKRTASRGKVLHVAGRRLFDDPADTPEAECVTRRFAAS
jgi:hypothetical protein